MSNRLTVLVASILPLVIALAGAACSEDSGSPETTVEPIATATQVAPSPTGSGATPTIRIVSPTDGAAVTSPVMVEVAVEGTQLMLGPNDELVAGAGHWHIFIDGSGQPEPYGTSTAQVEAPPGQHFIGVALYLNTNDTQPVSMTLVEVTVTE